MVNDDITSRKAKPSICIPHSIKNTNWLFVKNTFEKVFDSNCIKKVDIINNIESRKGNLKYSKEDVNKICQHLKIKST